MSKIVLTVYIPYLLLGHQIMDKSKKIYSRYFQWNYTIVNYYFNCNNLILYDLIKENNTEMYFNESINFLIII